MKILDAWAMGQAVVSTSVGCEGLDARDGENAIIADNPEDFAAAVVRALGDPVQRDRLGRLARETVENRYSWEVIGAEMDQRYSTLVGRRGDEV